MPIRRAILFYDPLADLARTRAKFVFLSATTARGVKCLCCLCNEGPAAPPTPAMTLSAERHREHRAEKGTQKRLDGEAAGARGEAADGADEVSRHEFTILPRGGGGGGAQALPTTATLYCMQLSSGRKRRKGQGGSLARCRTPPRPRQRHHNHALASVWWLGIAQHTPQSA